MDGHTVTPASVAAPGKDQGMQALGIDIGGTGMKAAPVDVATGTLLADRKKILTPKPATPKAVAEVVRELTEAFGWTGITGATFPGVVTEGTIRTAANLDKSWLGTDAAALFGQVTGGDVAVLNDADAAGVAEMTFGAGKGDRRTVLMLTFGTGIGSALFNGGSLVPNTEFGHIEIRGKDAELRASERGKTEHGWGWKEWAQRVDEYMQHVEALVSPDLIIIGGGVSKECEKWVPMLTNVRAEIVPATLLNDAGIVGAAMAAAGMAATGTHTARTDTTVLPGTAGR
jgi:polyphosphate glucokinase